MDIVRRKLLLVACLQPTAPIFRAGTPWTMSDKIVSVIRHDGQIYQIPWKLKNPGRFQIFQIFRM